MLDKLKFIFGSLFVLSNKMQVVIDQAFASYDITTKQWLLAAVIDEFFDTPPTVTQVAEAMGCSHQNVKQIALKLQKNGFLKMKKDEHDRRIMRLRLTEKNYSFWSERQEDDRRNISEIFKGLTDEEIDAIYSGFIKLSANIVNLKNEGD